MRALRNIAGLTLLALACATVAAWATLYLPGPRRRGVVVITVAEGARFVEVARQLRREGLVRHELPVALWARWSGADRRMRWGEYTMHAPSRPVDLVARLAAAPDAVAQVTIPEGLSMHEIARLLATEGLGSEDGFLCLLTDPRFLAAEDLPPAGAEGYLFPDTYAFPPTMPAARILATLIARFDEQVAQIAPRAAAVGLTLHEVVTLASLIEEETAVPEERRLVSAVFHNRLRRGMRLQADPTVLYGRADTANRRITHADLQRPTPYNTYVIQGLPPTPISSPGLASLEAAVDPAPVDFLYFVARGDGSHEFSRTLAAHNAAVDRYILGR